MNPRHYSDTIPIDQMMIACNATRQAVINAAKIHGVPIRGAWLGASVARLPLHFYETVIIEQRAINSRRQRAALEMKKSNVSETHN